MRNREIEREALTKAVSGLSMSNYPPIITGFLAKGIPAEQILPRENVFTYNAWRALGRQVRKGEHGVKCLTFIDTTKEDKRTGEKQESRRPWTTTVFHISQTDPINESEHDATDENVPYAGETQEVQS